MVKAEEDMGLDVRVHTLSCSCLVRPSPPFPAEVELDVEEDSSAVLVMLTYDVL